MTFVSEASPDKQSPPPFTRERDQDVMTTQVELKDEDIDKEKLKEDLKNTIRDVMKVRGDVEFVPRGAIPEVGKKIEDKRTWD